MATATRARTPANAVMKRPCPYATGRSRPASMRKATMVCNATVLGVRTVVKRVRRAAKVTAKTIGAPTKAVRKAATSRTPLRGGASGRRGHARKERESVRRADCEGPRGDGSDPDDSDFDPARRGRRRDRGRGCGRRTLGGSHGTSVRHSRSRRNPDPPPIRTGVARAVCGESSGGGGEMARMVHRVDSAWLSESSMRRAYTRRCGAKSSDPRASPGVIAFRVGREKSCRDA